MVIGSSGFLMSRNCAKAGGWAQLTEWVSIRMTPKSDPFGTMKVCEAGDQPCVSKGFLRHLNLGLVGSVRSLMP